MEGVQEVTEGLTQDIGQRVAGGGGEIGQDSFANLVLGALGGGPIGAARGFVSAETAVVERTAPAAAAPASSRKSRRVVMATV